MNPLQPAGIFFTHAYEQFHDATKKIKKGTLAVCVEGSRILYDFYSMDGMLYLTKWMIANFRILSLIPSISGVFAGALQSLEILKSTYYATLSFRSMVEFSKLDPVTGQYSFQMPQHSKENAAYYGSGIDYMKLSYAISGFFDTGQFLKKLNLLEFGFFSKVAARLGGINVFPFGGTGWKFADLPMLGRLCDSPKELFIWTASGIDVWRWWSNVLCGDAKGRARQLEWDRILSVTASMARMITLGMYRQFYGKWWIVTIDFIGQNASISKFILMRYKIHQKHLN